MIRQRRQGVLKLHLGLAHSVLGRTSENIIQTDCKQRQDQEVRRSFVVDNAAQHNSKKLIFACPSGLHQVQLKVFRVSQTA